MLSFDPNTCSTGLSISSALIRVEMEANMYFDFVKIPKGSPMLEEIYRLRYKVYCDEWGFERPEDHPARIECDLFDDHSSHFAAIRKDSGQLIGTVRIILNSPRGFPIEHHCAIDADLNGIDRERIAEISRFAVSKEYRRRLTDRIMFDGEDYNEQVERRHAVERRKSDHDIVLGLYSCVYRESLERGLTHLYAVMADGLQFLLRRAGVLCERIGPSVEYHGRRTPYLFSVEQVLRNLAEKNQELYARFMSSAA